MDSKSKVLLGSAVFFVSVLIFGCTTSQIQSAQTAPPLSSFPPQTAMQTGDYAGFFKENSEVLKSCQDTDKCATALFNLSFLYCYPKSPYYNPREGLKYINDLIAGAPESRWACEARVWKYIIERSTRRRIRKRPEREDAAKQVEEPQELKDETSQEKESIADRQRMEYEIKTKDELIDKLNRQIERSRQIDIEMEEKERGLLR